MRYRLALILWVGMFLSLGSCQVFKLSEKKDKTANQADALEVAPELTEQDQLKYEFAFVEGVKQKLLGNLNNALGYFYKCIEIDKTAAAPRYEISQINTMMEEMDVALRYAKEAVKYDPENKYYLEHLGQLNIQNNDFASAADQYETLIDQDHREPDYYFTLAQLYQQERKYQKALDNLNKLESRMGVNEQLSNMKRSLYIKMGKKEKAIDEVKKLIEEYPNETRYYGMLAEMYANFQEFDKAEEMYDKLFSLDSTNNLGQISKIQYLENSGRQQEAIKLFTRSVDNQKIDYGTKLLIFMNFLESRKTLRDHPNLLKGALDSLTAYYPDKFENHTLYADFYLKTNQYSEAAKELEYLVNSPEEKYIYWDQLASLYSFIGNFSKMFEVGKKGLDKYDSKPRLYLLTAMGASQTNRADTAIQLLKDGLVYINNDQQMLIDFYIQLAEAYHQKENYSQSDYYFEKVLNIDSDNVLVLNNYSYYLSLRNEKLDKALKMSEKAIEAEPKSAVYLDTYAWILFKKGNYAKAKEYIEKAVRYGGGDDSDIVEHYGDILYKTGDKENAVDQWEKARTLGNKSENLKLKIQNKKLTGEN